MIDARFKVTGLKTGQITVEWLADGRVITAWLDRSGALIYRHLFSEDGDTRKVDPARPSYAAVLSTIRGQWPAILAEADRQRDAAVEAEAARAYKRLCDDYVERLRPLSSRAADIAAKQLSEGRDLDGLKRHIRAVLDEWAGRD